MGDILDKLNKRRVKGTNNSLKKSSLIDSKDLERSLREEIAQEFTNKNNKTNKNHNK